MSEVENGSAPPPIPFPAVREKGFSAPGPTVDASRTVHQDHYDKVLMFAGIKIPARV